MGHGEHGGTVRTGLACLAMIARLQGVVVDEAQLHHQYAQAGTDLDQTTLLRAAKQIGLKARRVDVGFGELSTVPLPAVVQRRDGGYLVLAKASEDRVLVQDPLQDRPQTWSRAAFEKVWCGGLILITHRSSLTGEWRRFDFTWFIPVMVKYRHLLGEVLLASFFLQLFALVSPLFFQVVIDKVLLHHSLTTLDVLIVGLLGLAVFEAILGGLRTYLFAHTTHRIDVELGARLYRHLIALPLDYFRVRRVGDSVARVRELESIRGFLAGSTVTVLIDLAFTFVFLAVMFYYSPLLTAIVLGAIPFYVILSLLVTPVLRTRLNERFNRGAENQAFLVESLSGIETIKSLAIEPQLQRDWERQLAAYVSAAFRSQNMANVASQVAQLINKLMTALILWTGARLVMQGDLTVGQLVAFNMLAGRVSGPILRIVQLWQDLQQAGISLQRLGDVLNAQPEPQYDHSRTALPSFEGRIHFDHVGFRYRSDGPEVLSDISLDIPAGQVVGIVGRSGSGKSTLTKLIQRLYVPESGRLLVDGVDLALIQPAWLRRHIGVVLQENVLFNRSVRENIALADPSLPMEQIIRAARLAGAHEFILELPEGYDTALGEQGSNLSGGQRQRIAIARALVTDPRVLIFDEATSALDYESEHLIQTNMASICARRTVLIIAHRLSTVRSCDRIVVLDRGRIVEEGCHASLIRSGGQYARLHALQSDPPSAGDREEDASAPEDDMAWWSG